LTSEVIDIRQFTAREFEPLLETESRAWSANLRWNYTASRRLISTCLDDRKLSGYALRSEGRITAYSFFFYEGEKGLIGNLFVAPDGDRLAPALVLLEHVIETLLATPGLRRVETQLPHFTYEELEPCFRAQAFESYLRRFMALSLVHRPLGSPSSHAAKARSAHGTAPGPEAFRLEPWERRHDQAAAELLYDTYRYHVDARINDQYTSSAGATRLIENIVHQRGCGELLPPASLVAVHRPTQKLAGVLAVTAVRPRTAHIPQVAVAGEFQGAGLGAVMMERSFQELAAQGYEEVSLTVTDLNASAVRLYEHLGFETFRTFGAFVWDRR
jgi:ribosomal protein S18 acetylase RimI-like enzyme